MANGPGELVFVSRTGKRITAISDTFQRSVDALGLNDGVTDSRKRVWFHTLRHTFASWLAQSGEFTLQEIQEYMRHDRIEMTERYAHLIPGQKKDKLRLIADRLNGAAA